MLKIGPSKPYCCAAATRLSATHAMDRGEPPPYQCDQTFFSEPATLSLKNGHLLNTDKLKTATHRPETGHYVMNSPNFSGHTNPKNGQVGRKRPRLVTLPNTVVYLFEYTHS